MNVRSYASKLRRGRGRVPDYKLNNRNGTRTAVFGEVTSPKRQNSGTSIVVPHMQKMTLFIISTNKE